VAEGRDCHERGKFRGYLVLYYRLCRRQYARLGNYRGDDVWVHRHFGFGGRAHRWAQTPPRVVDDHARQVSLMPMGQVKYVAHCAIHLPPSFFKQKLW